MANTLITPSVIAREALANLYANAVAPQLVHRDFDSEFQGKRGDTITVRRPAQFTADEFAGTINVQNANEGSVTVTLDTLLDVSFEVTSRELTLEIDEFSSRFIVPAMEAIVQGLDTRIIAALSAAGLATVGVEGTTPTDPTILVDAAKVLNDNKVPMANRKALLSTGTAAELLKDPLFHQADQRGDTIGLQEATVGRKFGFDTFQDQNITDGDSYAFHPTAVALATRTLAAPQGVAASQVSVVNYKGFGLRVVQDYDIARKTDVVSIDLLAGVAILDASRAVEILG